MRVIGMEHPRLRATQIDVDGATDAEPGGAPAAGSGRPRTRPHGATASGTPRGCTRRRCARGAAHRNGRQPSGDGMRLQVRTPGDLQSLELAAFDRVPPGPGQIEVVGQRVQHQLRRRPRRVRAVPELRGRLPSSAADFAGVVTAVGEGVTDPPGRRPRRRNLGQRLRGARSSPATPASRSTLPDGIDRGPGRRGRAQRARHRVVRPARSGTDRRGRQGADPLRHRWRRAGGDRHCAGGGRRDLRHRWQRGAAGVVARLGNRARLRLAQHRVRRPDPQGHRRLRRRRRAQLPHRRGPAAGLELLAFGGRFVEIGKRDIYGDTRLGLFPFRRNLSFYAVDLALLTITNPDKVRGLLQTRSTSRSPTACCRCRRPRTTRSTDAATAIREIGGGRAHRQAGARRPAHRAEHVWWCRPSRLRSSASTVPTSSPAVSAVSGCSWPRRWPQRAAGASSSTVASATERRGAGGHRADPSGRRYRGRGRAAATSPRPDTAERSGGGGDRDGTSAARRAARRGGRRGRHAGQHHRRAHRT